MTKFNLPQKNLKIEPIRKTPNSELEIDTNIKYENEP